MRFGDLDIDRGAIRYTYDFGDGWEHEIVVEAFGTAELGGQYPRCIGGEDQCPGFGPRIGALLTDDRSLDFAGRPHVPVTPGSLLGGAGPAEAGTAEELR